MVAVHRLDDVSGEAPAVRLQPALLRPGPFPAGELLQVAGGEEHQAGLSSWAGGASAGMAASVSSNAPQSEPVAISARNLCSDSPKNSTADSGAGHRPLVHPVCPSNPGVFS